MASEILAVPEERLPEAVRVIRMGLAATDCDGLVSEETQKHLLTWCDDIDWYLHIADRG